MVRVAVPYTVRAEEHQSVKSLAQRFVAVNDYVTGVNVQCSVCKARGRVNSRLVKGKRIVCASCVKAAS